MAHLQMKRNLGSLTGRQHDHPCIKTPTAAPAPRRLHIVRAKPESGVDKVALSVGMPTESGFFGFTPFAEVWTGRWAMLGVASSIVGEFVTHKPTLQQIGLSTPSYPLFIGLIAFFGTALVAASAYTSKQLVNKEMSTKDMNRYRNFLGLVKEEDADAQARRMKEKGDFTTPSIDTAAIAETRRNGMPADNVLGSTSSQRAESQEQASSSVAVADPPAPQRPPPEPYQEDLIFNSGEQRYSRDVEMANGRAAMLGFLGIILVEAATGQGVIGQMFGYAKALNLLGPQSGF